jgi:nucleotide-binding universal stress UspA family protein
MKTPLYLLLVLPLDNRKIYLDPETGQPFKADADPFEQCAFVYKYLSHIQQDLAERGIECHQELMEGKPEERIIEFIEKTRPILTILATHAYPKVEQALLGNIAEK